MGITWCRERVEQAQNSKSPVDRILVRCSKVISPKSAYSSSPADDIVYRGMRNPGVSHPIPVHMVPPRTHRLKQNLEWQNCTLSVPDSTEYPNSKTPIPPPRKKRKRRINSLEILNTQLQLLRQPGYTISSENLLNHEYITQNSNRNSKSVVEPLSTWNYNEEKLVVGNEQKRYNRFMKSSGRKADPHPPSLSNDVRDEKVKNDNTKKAEQKIKVVKNVSTVSLPNYNELVKPAGKVSSDVENSDDKTGNQSGGYKPPHRNSSTLSLPGEGSNSILTSLSEATIQRLESYMKKCRSFGSFKQHQLLEKLEEFNRNRRTPSESSDSWAGLDDWDLGVIEYCDPEANVSPVQPQCRVDRHGKSPMFSLGPEEEYAELTKNDVRRVPSDWFELKKGKTPPPSPNVNREKLPEDDFESPQLRKVNSTDSLERKRPLSHDSDYLKVQKPIILSDSNLMKSEKSMSNNLLKMEALEDSKLQKIHRLTNDDLDLGNLGKPVSSDSDLLKLEALRDDSNLLKLQKLSINDSHLDMDKLSDTIPEKQPTEDYKEEIMANKLQENSENSEEGEINAERKIIESEEENKEIMVNGSNAIENTSSSAPILEITSSPLDPFCQPNQEVLNNNIINDNELLVNPPLNPLVVDLTETNLTTEKSNQHDHDEPKTESPPDDSTLLKILQQSKEEVPKEEVPVPPRRRSKDKTPPLRKRKRSSSLKMEKIINYEIAKFRSPSITFETPESLLEQIKKSSSEIDIKTQELIRDVEKRSLYHQLPEDPFDMLITRKKPSLRESLSEFLGFGQEPRSKEVTLSPLPDPKPNLSEPEEEKVPPPLPLTPPPLLDPPPHSEIFVNSSDDLVSQNHEKNEGEKVAK